MLSFSVGHQAQAAQQQQTTLWFIVDPKRVGDVAMGEGISMYLAPLLEESDSTLKTEFKTVAELAAATKLPNIVFGVGDVGLAGLSTLTNDPRRKDIKLAWVAHQAYEDLYPIAANLDLIFLPKHAITVEVQQKLTAVGVDHKSIVTTVGVAHSLTVAKVNRAAEDWQHNLALPRLPAAEKQILLVLGGDAEDTSKKWHKLTVAEVERLADFISGMVDAKTVVFIANGPRVGKFNGEDLDLTAHQNPNKDGSMPDLKVPTDQVTKAFLERLKAKIGPQRIFFSDFIYDLPSVYKPMIGHVQADFSGFVAAFVTGDSSTMLSEMGDVLPPNLVIPVVVGSMSEVHHAHIASVREAGCSIVELEGDRFVLRQNLDSGKQSYPPAAYVIAQGVMDALKQEPRPKSANKLE